MIYFGIEIYKGIPLKQMRLDETTSLENQWYNLTQDITCIDYLINEELEFSLDVGWYPESKITPDSYFKTIIIEGPITEGGIFFERFSKNIQELKIDMIAAIELLHKFENFPTSKILEMKIRDFN